MSTETTMTIKEAIASGYKYCIHDDGESGLIHLEEGMSDLDNEHFLVEKEPTMTYQIHEDTIKDYLSDHICGQDEVSDEDCELADLIVDIDFTAITEEVNKVLRTKKYYNSTKIRLVK